MKSFLSFFNEAISLRRFATIMRSKAPAPLDDETVAELHRRYVETQARQKQIDIQNASYRDIIQQIKTASPTARKESIARQIKNENTVKNKILWRDNETTVELVTSMDQIDRTIDRYDAGHAWCWATDSGWFDHYRAEDRVYMVTTKNKNVEKLEYKADPDSHYNPFPCVVLIGRNDGVMSAWDSTNNECYADVGGDKHHDAAWVKRHIVRGLGVPARVFAAPAIKESVEDKEAERAIDWSTNWKNEALSVFPDDAKQVLPELKYHHLEAEIIRDFGDHVEIVVMDRNHDDNIVTSQFVWENQESLDRQIARWKQKFPSWKPTPYRRSNKYGASFPYLGWDDVPVETR